MPYLTTEQIEQYKKTGYYGLASKNKSLFCKKCSKEITDDSKFCPWCGSQLDKTFKDKNERLKGISGWLLLPGLGLLFSIFYLLYSFFVDIFPLITNAELWAFLTTPASEVYSHLWKPTIFYESIVKLLILALTIGVFVLYVKHKKSFPGLYIILIILNLVFVSIDYYLVEELLNSNSAIKEYIDLDNTGLSQAVSAAFIWIPYTLVSKRVKNTFIN